MYSLPKQRTAFQLYLHNLIYERDDKRKLSQMQQKNPLEVVSLKRIFLNQVIYFPFFCLFLHILQKNIHLQRPPDRYQA